MIRKLSTWSAFALLMLVPVYLAASVTSVSISPSGTLDVVSNVKVTFTYVSDTSNADTLSKLEAFDVKYNGADETALVINAAVMSEPTPQTVQLTVEYLFPPGTYSFSSTVKLQGENPVTGQTSFTVPGDEQQRRKNTTINKISEFLHRYDAYTFAQWISLGNLGTFSNRIHATDMQVYVDPGYLGGDGGAVAAYVEAYIWKYIWTVYEHDLVIGAEPESFSVDGGTNDSATLWHEMIHAVSHGLQLSGSASQFSFNDDHLYIEWAESCNRGFNFLTRFDDYIKGDSVDAARARNYWKAFKRECNGSLYSRVPTDAEKGELKTMIGFDVDPKAIRAGYLGMGYPPEYFDDITVTITSPSNGDEVAENQVDVSASLQNNEPDLQIDKVGISVNGVDQFATLSGTSFSSVAVLATGDNRIYAFVETADGDRFESSPITVKSTALLNTYHARISWNKDDTDVDLHFSWSGGSECYYSRKTPDWGGPEVSPKLDVDDTNGYGPENITIDALPGPGTYKIWVYYYSDHGNGGTTVNAAIYENGVAIWSGSRSMSNHDSWTLLELTIP